MRTFLAPLLLAALAVQTVRAGDKDDSPPVPIAQPEPEWEPELSTSYLINPTKVTLVIDERGIPFSVSGGGLPDNVVKALSQWRYRPGKKDGSNVPFSVSLVVPVRVALDTSSERSLRRGSYYISKAVELALQTGTGLDVGRAEQLEQSLSTDLNNIDIRAQLLLYSVETTSSNAKDAAERRARNIEFLVQNLPESTVLANPFTAINTSAGPLPDPESYARIRDLWLSQILSKPDDSVMLGHATYFLRISDPEKTEQLLLPAIRSLPEASVWLGDLYGLALLGVNGIDLKTGAAASASPALPATAFAKKAHSALSGTNNPKIVISALNTIVDHGRALAHLDALPEGYPALCAQFLSRVKEFYPATAISCDLSATIPDPPLALSRIRVGGNVQQANLIKKVTPAYPSEAKGRGIQGVVRFTAIIDKDGSISNLTLVSGPLALYKSARDAVKQWMYRPTMLNGKPVQVVTALEVNYTLSR